MELVAYFFLVTLVSVGSFWLAGVLYGLLRKPSIYFPLSLAVKMALCAVFGGLMFLVGGVVLSTLVFNAEMAKRPDYRKWPTILSGLVISVACTVLIYVSVFALAWQVFE